MNHVIIPTIALITACIIGCAPSASAQPTDTRVREIASLLPETPKGYGPPCSDRKAWTSSDLKQRLQDILTAADNLKNKEFPKWDDAAYLEYSQTGNRRGGEAMMNSRKAWLFPLVIAECIKNDNSYIPAIEKTLTALNTQPVWNWPAHDRQLKIYENKDYEVDLVSADLAHDLSQALYMLGKKISEKIRKETEDQLEERVFNPIKKTINEGNNKHKWLYEQHNWNAVCLKGVTASALTTIKDKKIRAFFAAIAEEQIKNYLNGFPSDGYAIEGPTYWNYGFSHFSELRETLFTSTDGVIDLFTNPGVRAIALYGFRFEMTPGNIAAFGDASAAVGLDEFTKAYVNEALRLNQKNKLATLPISSTQPGNAAPLANAVLRLFGNPIATTGPNSGQYVTSDYDYFDNVGVLVSRPTSSGGLAITIKAAGNGTHSHNDIGSYTIGVNKEQPTGDPGAAFYSRKTFSKDRYQIRGISSWGHPVPVVNGQLQVNANTIHPKVINSDFSKSENKITIDMQKAYKSEELKTLTRTMTHNRSGSGTIIIEDSYEYNLPGQFEVALITKGHATINPDSSVDLWENNEHITAKIESSSFVQTSQEKIDEDGIKFTRVSAKTLRPSTKGYIKIIFKKSTATKLTDAISQTGR